jgi:hypothetical protein
MKCRNLIVLKLGVSDKRMTMLESDKLIMTNPRNSVIKVDAKYISTIQHR